MHGRLTLALLAGLALSSAALAAPKPLDAEQTTPYLWRVVLKVTPHPTLTKEFRERLVRDLRGALQPLLGEELGRVEVIDLADAPANPDPLWAAVEKHGLAAMDDKDKFAAFRTLTGVKTHFLTVEVADGKYRLAARQHDGSTGLVSPVVRRGEATAETVGRVAGLVVGRDFGLVGTVQPIAGQPMRAAVAFRGGRLPGFDPLVRAGDVLAFAVVADQPRPSREPPKKPGPPPEPVADRVGRPLSYTLLRVTHVLPDGEAKCDVLTGFVSAFSRGAVGYRCMKLTTGEAATRVRLAGTDGKPPSPTTPVRLWASDTGFEEKSDPRTALDLRGGVYAGGRPLKGVACLTVSLGAGEVKTFALPVVDGAEPPTLTFKFDPAEIARADFEDACERVRMRLLDLNLAQQELFDTLAKMIKAGKNEDALKRATDALAASKQVDADQSAQLDKLQRDPLAQGDAAANQIAVAKANLATLRSRLPRLEATLKDLAIAAAKANDPIKYEKEFRIHEKQREIDFHLGLGEVPEALALYDELFELSQNEKAKQLKEKLAAEWKPQDAGQEAARKYATEEFRQAMTLPDIKAAAAKLRTAIETLVAKKDRYGLRAARASVDVAYSRLGDLAAPLDRSVATDAGELKDIDAASKALRAVEEDAVAAAKRLDEEKAASEPKPDDKK